MAARKSILIASSVSVVCPYCGDCQPNADGSEMWIEEDFQDKHGTFKCVACDKSIVIEITRHAFFDFAAIKEA